MRGSFAQSTWIPTNELVSGVKTAARPRHYGVIHVEVEFFFSLTMGVRLVTGLWAKKMGYLGRDRRSRGGEDIYIYF